MSVLKNENILLVLDDLEQEIKIKNKTHINHAISI